MTNIERVINMLNVAVNFGYCFTVKYYSRYSQKVTNLATFSHFSNKLSELSYCCNGLNCNSLYKIAPVAQQDRATVS